MHIVHPTAHIQTEIFQRGRRWGVRVYTSLEVPLPHESFARPLRLRLGDVRYMKPRFVKVVMKRRSNKHVWFEMTLPPGDFKSAAVCLQKIVVPRILTEHKYFDPRTSGPSPKQATVRRPQLAHA